MWWNTKFCNAAAYIHPPQGSTEGLGDVWEHQLDLHPRKGSRLRVWVEHFSLGGDEAGG